MHPPKILECDSVIAFLNFQVHRFESEAPEIELALANVSRIISINYLPSLRTRKINVPDQHLFYLLLQKKNNGEMMSNQPTNKQTNKQTGAQEMSAMQREGQLQHDSSSVTEWGETG
jgi:hypothetical protein